MIQGSFINECVLSIIAVEFVFYMGFTEFLLEDIDLLDLEECFLREVPLKRSHDLGTRVDIVSGGNPYQQTAASASGT